MKFSLNPKFTQPLKFFFKQLIGYNRLYRIFLFIVLLSWNDWNWIAALILFPFSLIVLDSKFRNYCLAVRRRYYQKKEKEEKKLAKNNPTWQDFLNLPKNIGFWILSKILPYITRLPIVEDYFQGNLNHYQYRNCLQFRNLLEATCHKIYAIHTEIDQYHITYFIRLFKPLTPGKAKLKINQALKKYFGEIPGGVMIRLKRTTGQILIPEELLRIEKIL